LSGVKEYIEKQISPQKEICRKLCALIYEIFPNIAEEMKWGVPAFGDGKIYIVALKDHVNLGFSTKNLRKQELSLFDGGGKTTNHIEIESFDKIDRKRITEFLKLVAKRSG
jgi:hypothetical protein